jgi:hypothetical protein
MNKQNESDPSICISEGGNVAVRHVHKPFAREPDFGATSVNYNLDDLLARNTECQ